MTNDNRNYRKFVSTLLQLTQSSHCVRTKCVCVHLCTLKVWSGALFDAQSDGVNDQQTWRVNVKKHVSMTLLWYTFIWTRLKNESVEIFQGYLGGFSTWSCFHHQLFIAIFRFSEFLGAMETQLLKQIFCLELNSRAPPDSATYTVSVDGTADGGGRGSTSSTPCFQTTMGDGSH